MKDKLNFDQYKGILPYSSEIFGVYQPMIGWKSNRIVSRLKRSLFDKQNILLQIAARNFKEVITDFSPRTGDLWECHIDIGIEAGTLRPSVELVKDYSSIVMQNISKNLPIDRFPTKKEWDNLMGKLNDTNDRNLESILNTVERHYEYIYNQECQKLKSGSDYLNNVTTAPEKLDQLIMSIRQSINEESILAGTLLNMIKNKMYSNLETIFYQKTTIDILNTNKQISDLLSDDDPFLTIDPKNDIKNVSLSPLGVVHLFRQYFFELDTFLGTPVSHVWLSPGSTVELIEVSTRREYTEKIIEISNESVVKTEKSNTNQDDISDAIKQENKSDVKLGASATVNQSWGTGNASATASLNLDNTQQTAREHTHKRMRQQSEKLSTEIRQNYKSTFKTITEITDTSSKRFLLNNTTNELINYEFRRKMRQVGVQVQDIGTYLCWETFVNEPGRELSLANLVHIAKPADLVTVPDQTQIPIPPNQMIPITCNAVWDFPDTWMTKILAPLGLMTLPPAPDGFEPIGNDGDFIPLVQVSATGANFKGVWDRFVGQLSNNKTQLLLFKDLREDSLNHKDRVDFVLGGALEYTPTKDKKEDIAKANKATFEAGKAANAENQRKSKEAFVKAAKERIEFASNINTRKYEDLREEERIIVYRNLISDLMSEALYKLPESKENNRNRHVLSALINSIFDIDKMLYFVAPEWWKPRIHSRININLTGENLTGWSDQNLRPANYYITENSKYAKMGSSLGWLLQLDGDDLSSTLSN